MNLNSAKYNENIASNHFEFNAQKKKKNVDIFVMINDIRALACLYGDFECACG